MTITPSNLEDRLGTLNGRLADLTGMDAIPLVTGGAQTLGDQLWVWGVLGGKEVGKSTLINALAGAEVVDRGEDVGEGTFRPAAYFTERDGDVLSARFASLNGLDIDYRPEAPESMKGLALIDLPDFDSLFTHHVDQVRRIAGALDGIIWVTTPKKVGDHRAIREIQRVLKSRTNFVYVVNKVDWLLGQSAGPPLAELERVTSALKNQVSQSGGNGADGRCFLISARFQSPSDIVAEIARNRNAQDVDRVRAELGGAADRVARDFDNLRTNLTTPPTAEATLANKRANLTYQVQTQARRLLDHYQPQALLDRLDRNAGDERIAELVDRSFPQAYCDQLIQRLNDERSLFADWSTLLFRKRIAHWPLLGVIAWPFALLGATFGGLRNLLPTRAAARSDLFALDGIDLLERTEAILTAVRAKLAAVSQRMIFDLPQSDALAQRFEADTRALAGAHRDAVIDRLARRRPTFIGRFFRWLIPSAVLLWFPLAQPILSAALGSADIGLNTETLRLIVDIFSAANVLTGLGVAGLILAAIVAAIYSLAARDAYRAIDALRAAAPDVVAQPLTHSLTRTITHPITQTRTRLQDVTHELRELTS